MKSHFHKLITITLLAIMSLGLMRCGGDDGDGTPIVARYKKKALSTRQLEHYIPQGSSVADSTRFADLFIERWLREEAIVDVALESIPELEEEVQFKMEDYRKKLILHQYTTKLIQDSLNREVPLAEVKVYYDQHKDDFLSNENLYKYFYISTAERKVTKIKNWMRTDEPALLDSLRNWSQVNALEYKLDSSWVGETKIREISKGYYGDLKNVRPGKLIRWNGVIQGQQRRYMFKMLELVEMGENLPFSLTEDRIRRMLLNERKSQLVENVEERILKDAKTNNYIQK